MLGAWSDGFEKLDKECPECGFITDDLEEHKGECMTPDNLRRGYFFAEGSKGLKAKKKLELEDVKHYYRMELKRKLNPLNFLGELLFLIRKSL